MSITRPRAPGFAALPLSRPARCRSLGLRGFLPTLCLATASRPTRPLAFCGGWPVGGGEGAPDHCRGTGEDGLGRGGLGSAAQRRCRESEDRAAVATGNDGQQTMDCESIVDGDGEQCDVLPEARQETMTTVNCPALTGEKDQPSRFKRRFASTRRPCPSRKRLASSLVSTPQSNKNSASVASRFNND